MTAAVFIECTTRAGNKQHWTEAGGARQTLCGAGNGYSQLDIDAGQGPSRPVTVVDLPACRLCDRFKAARTRKHTAVTAARTVPVMSEDDLLSAVLDLCKLYRLRVAHFRPARTGQGWRTPVEADGAGFPDLVIVGSIMIVRELKGASGQVTPEQRTWLDRFDLAGVDSGVWRPAQWHDGTIDAQLKRLRT
jgi:hypothetical protein